MEKIDIKTIIPCYNIYKEHGGSLDAQEYDRVAYKAMHYIGYVTLNRAYPHVGEDDNIYWCHAELCDQFYAINTMQMQINTAKDITQEVVGTHSVHYATTAENLQAARDALYPIVKRWLVPYMYRGIPVVV